MPEKIHIWRPDRRKESQAEIIPGDQFPVTGYEGCQRVQVMVYRSNRFKHLPMVTKRPWFVDPEALETQPDIPGADQFISIWEQLIKVGIPTLPTVRKISADTVLMTDLTRDGSNVYGKHQAWMPESLLEDPISQAVHKAFLEIDPKTIELASRNTFNKATKNQVALAHDGALELVVSTTGAWCLVALDIGKTMFNTEFATSLNDLSHTYLMGYLDTLRNHLRNRVHLYRST